MENYIKNIKLKRSLVGGYERQDVNDKIHILLKMHQEAMKKEQEEKKKLVSYYENKVKEMQLQIDGLIVEHETSELEKVKIKNAYKDYCTNMLQQYSESLRSLSTEFTQIMENISRLQKNLVQGNILEGVEIKSLEENVSEIGAADMMEVFEELHAEQK